MADPATFDPFATGTTSPAAGTTDWTGRPFTGYGAAPETTAPSSFADEVRARAARIQYTGRGAAAAAAPVAEAPAVAAMKPPSWLKTAGGFGARAAAPLALGAMATGVGRKAVDEINKGTNAPSDDNSFFTNRWSRLTDPALSLNLASGADITGLGARIGNKMFGTGDFSNPNNPPEPNPMLGPEGQKFAQAHPSGLGANPAPVAAPVPPVVPRLGVPADRGTPAPDYRSTVAYSPLTNTKDANGNTVITGSGQSTDYLNRPQVQVDRMGNQIGTGFGVGNGGYHVGPQSLNGEGDTGFFSSMGQVVQANANRHQANYEAKLGVEGMAAGAAAGEHMANAQSKQLINAMTLKLLDPSVSDTAKEQIRASLVSMHGRAAAGQFSVPMNAMPDASGAMPVLNRATGAITKTSPTQKVTSADFEAAKKQYPNKTPAQIIEGYRMQGHDVSALKP